MNASPALKALAVLALFLTLGASADGCAKPPASDKQQASRRKPPAERACQKVPRAGDVDVSGKVAPDSYTDPDGPNCLEIKTRDGIRRVRVSRRVYNNCQTGYRWPRCAGNS